MEKIIASWQFEPSLENAAVYRKSLNQQLTARGIELELIEKFELALSELVVNLCRYPLQKATNVQLHLVQSAQTIGIELYDNGASFSDFSQHIDPQGTVSGAESGMGLKLIQQLFDDVFYVPACYREDNLNLMVVNHQYQFNNSAANNQQKKATLPKNILIIDDDPVYLAVIKAYLTPEYKIDCADNITSAFERLLRYKPDLVICDINMPGGSGAELFDKIQHIPSVSSVAFIYLTGCTDQNILRSALARPIDNIITKPVERGQLIALIKQTLLRREYLKQQLEKEFSQRATLGLAPKLPRKIGNYHCALRYCVPSAGGGDFVLLHASQLVMADLMGHGLQAKHFVYALAGYLRGLCSALASNEMAAAALLNCLSDSFNSDPVLRETLATIAVLNFNSQGIAIANAGHPTPFIISEQHVKKTVEGGALLGISALEYQETLVVLAASERLLVFSDGYLDAAQDPSAALLKVLKQSALLPIQQAADLLYQEVLDRPTLSDDCTFILLEKSFTDLG
ncbi:MAG: SpoIIE family protein phosphatase [Oceanospirillaceae bacterium]|nr:SpoIIE family protein phosphatase [Oceanospirillaceae bacterium]